MEVYYFKMLVNCFYNLIFEYGKKYYVIVRVENSRGEYVSLFLDGVVVDWIFLVGKLF